MIDRLIQLRDEKGLTQVFLAKKLSKPQSYISKTEGLERRLDVIELMDWLSALDSSPIHFLESLKFEDFLNDSQSISKTDQG